MPEVPAFVAGFVERRASRHARVLRCEQLAPRLRRIRFEVPSLKGSTFQGGDEIEFRVSSRSLRHYTIEALDADRGTCDVLFYLHGDGPGTAWARGLSEGDDVRLIGPGKGMHRNQVSAQHVLLGDESALGLFSALSRRGQGNGKVIGAVEVAHGSNDYPSRAGLSVTPLANGDDERGQALLDWIDGLAPFGSDTTFYLAGCSASVAALRRRLVRDHGVDKRSVRVRAYWTPGRRGL